MSDNDDIVNRLSQEQISEIDKVSSETRELIQAEAKTLQETEKSDSEHFKDARESVGEYTELCNGQSAQLPVGGTPAVGEKPATEAQTLMHDFAQQSGGGFYEKNKDLEPEQE